VKSPRPLEEGVEFVDHDERGCRQQPRGVGRPAGEHGFDRLGRDQGNALRPGQGPLLIGLRRIPVPFHNGNAHVVAQFVQTLKLVVDQRLQRADVEDGKARFFALRHLGEDGQESSFRLSGRGRRRDQDVPIAVQHGIHGASLNFPQFVPTLISDPTTDRRMKLVVCSFKG
jgi:hypothetical protein